MNNTILLWGASGDPALMALRGELHARGTPHFFLDQCRMHLARFEWGADGVSGHLCMDADCIDLASVGALYARPSDLREALCRSRELADAAASRHAAHATERQLYAWAEMTPALVANRPSAASANDSKPYQLEQIRAAGFAVPATLVTTLPQAAREFVASQGRVICKSAGRARSSASRLDAADRERLDDVTHCPTLFQAYVAGVDWRVHVFGDAVYACEIRCDADDYRLAPATGAALDIVPALLPAELAARCRSLARQLGLILAGIDLRRSGDTWYCFEVNPSPLFTYFEYACGQPLTAALADLLSAAASGRLH